MLLRQRLAIDGLVHQKTDQVRPRGRPASCHLGREEGIDLPDHAREHRAVLDAVAGKIMDPGAEAIAVALAHPQHPRDHARRHVARVLRRRIAPARTDEAVDQLVAHAARDGLERVDRRRRESRQQHHALGPVLRRVGGDGRDRRRDRRLLEDGDAARGEMLGVVGVVRISSWRTEDRRRGSDRCVPPGNVLSDPPR